jgi:hypothetical protein
MVTRLLQDHHELAVSLLCDFGAAQFLKGQDSVLIVHNERKDFFKLNLNRLVKVLLWVHLAKTICRFLDEDVL